MSLVHTLLFFVRADHYADDLLLTEKCLKSLSTGTYKKVVIYNQGCISNDELRNILDQYDLEYYILGKGINIGIVAGRQNCFQYIWSNLPNTKYISELHLDMIFSKEWENSLIDYLTQHDEPVISSGIITSSGSCVNLKETVYSLPQLFDEWEPFLHSLQENVIIPGFTHPCIHVSQILQEVGGYDLKMLNGSQYYEDDSLLLSYYLYYGTRSNWHPKINYNSVVYHECAAQRLGLDNCIQNYLGLIQQYGIMGQKYLSLLHSNLGQKQFFKNQYEFLSEIFNKKN